MGEGYKIVNFADLLRVPADRRTDCLRELQYSLAFLELAFDADLAYERGVQGFTWVDDGVKRVDLRDEHGNDFLRLEISKAGDKP